MRFSRQGYWSGLPFPSPGDLPNPGFEPGSPTLQADSLLTELQVIKNPNSWTETPRSYFPVGPKSTFTLHYLGTHQLLSLLWKINIIYPWIICVLSHSSSVWLCDPMDCSLPGSSVHGIIPARILEWVVISFSRGSSRFRDWTCVSSTGRKILYPWSQLGSSPFK